MALSVAQPITITLNSVEADRWEIGYYRVDNQIGVTEGNTLVIQLIAVRKTGPSTYSNPTPLPLQSYSGHDLSMILDRAGQLFEVYRARGADFKTAYYFATRDALYERLKSDGLIPVDAH